MNVSAKNAPLAAATENDPRWASVIAYDPEADGAFVYSVTIDRNDFERYGLPDGRTFVSL